MENKNIINFLFNKKEDDELFDLDDAELETLNNKSDKSSKEINNFIDTKVHPKCRKKLKKLIFQYNQNLGAVLHRENELFYENGFSDCLKFILTALLLK